MAFWNKKNEQQPPPHPAPPAAAPAAAQAALPAAAPATQAVPPAAAPAEAKPARASQPSLNSQLAGSLGKVISVLMFQERYRSLTLADIATTILPPVATNQFVVAEARPQGQDVTAPIGLVLWARLSDDLDQQFVANPGTPTILKGAQWKSGNNLWIIETAGPADVVEAMVKQLIQGPFKDKHFKVRAKLPDGSYTVQAFN